MSTRLSKFLLGIGSFVLGIETVMILFFPFFPVGIAVLGLGGTMIFLSFKKEKKVAV